MRLQSTSPSVIEPSPHSPDAPPAPGPLRRVLMVAYTFPPATSVGVFRTLRFVKYLPESGWQPAMVSVDPAARGERTDAALLDELPADLRILRVWPVRPEEQLKRWIPLLRRRASVARAAAAASGVDEGEPLSYRHGTIPITFRRRVGDLLFGLPDDKVGWIWSGLRPALRKLREWKPEVIYATGPPFTAHVLAALLARRSGLPLVLDFRDPWSRCPWGPRKDIPFSQRMLARMEAWCVRQAAAVVLNTERLREEFAAFYSDQPQAKFRTISNGYDPDLAERVGALAPPAWNPSGQSALEVLHPGSLYLQRDPRPIVEALALLASQGLRVRFVQYGPCDPAFRTLQRAEELGVSELVSIHPPVPHQQLLERMRQADALLLLQPGTSLQVPGKLFEMLLFDKPIVALADPGETADLVHRFSLGAVALPNDPAGIAGAIRAAISDASAEARRRLRPAALDEFSGRRLTAELASVLQTVAPARTKPGS